MTDATHGSQSKRSFIYLFIYLLKTWFLNYLHTKAKLDDLQQDIKMSPSNDMKRNVSTHQITKCKFLHLCVETFTVLKGFCSFYKRKQSLTIPPVFLK